MKFKIKEIDLTRYYYYPAYGVVQLYDPEKQTNSRMGMSCGFIGFKKPGDTGQYLAQCGISWFMENATPIVVHYSDLVEYMIEDLPI